jgi:uncharacterized ferritin-like protein (DUF455 family)
VNVTLVPEAGTVERWAWDYVSTQDLAHKLDPIEPPSCWETLPVPRRITAPGRPPELQRLDKAPKRVGRSALQNPRRRAQLFHTFLHHEMQAAELMAWAILAFPGTPRAFRRGLLGICREELRHLRAYHEHLRTLGAAAADFPVRDWFWIRVPQARTPAEFVAVMGLGLEGGNLDHAERYAEWFAAAGDDRAARILQSVGADEVRHVRFAARWFRRFTGSLDFEAWLSHLPAPLTPRMLRGHALNRRDRLRAGMNAAFLDRLAEW